LTLHACLERDLLLFVETETGFGSSFSESVSSIYETETSFRYLVQPSSILVSPVSLAKVAKLRKFEITIIIKITA